MRSCAVLSTRLGPGCVQERPRRALKSRPARDRVIFLLSDHGFEAHWKESERDGVITGHHRSEAALYGIFVAAESSGLTGLE